LRRSSSSICLKIARFFPSAFERDFCRRQQLRLIVMQIRAQFSRVPLSIAVNIRSGELVD